MASIYKGCARIYLQGKGALLPYGSLNGDELNYHVGSEETSLRVKDFRQEAIEAARKVLSGESDIRFVDFFNRSAQVTITKKSNGIEIELHESNDNPDFPILWLGVIHNGKMPVHKIFWEILKPIDDKNTAFAAIVED